MKIETRKILTSEKLNKKKVGHLPNDWDREAIQQCIIKKRINVGKVKQRDYKKLGKYPIIDQGLNLVAGYWDEDDDVFKGDLPVIIFGDHTRIVKFINFHFVCGADGTKVLIPNKQKVDPLFFYFALLNLDIPSRGYNRHYSLLKDKKVALPEIPEQRKIAYVLSTIKDSIEKTENSINAFKELKKSLLKHLFTYGPVGTGDVINLKLKATEIGEIPKDWDIVKLEEICKLLQYGTSKRCGNDNTKIPVIRIPNVVNGKIDLSDLKYTDFTEKELNKLKLEEGDIIFVRTNASRDRVGRCAVFNSELETITFASYLIRAKIENEIVEPKFLYYYSFTNTGKSFLSGKANRASDGKHNINQFILKNVLLPVPPISIQQQIISILSTVDEKIEKLENKRNSIDELFKSMLHDLMTAERRVNHLEVGNG